MMNLNPPPILLQFNLDPTYFPVYLLRAAAAAAEGGRALISCPARLALIPHAAAAAAAAVPEWDILGICAWNPSLALILSEADQNRGQDVLGCLAPLIVGWLDTVPGAEYTGKCFSGLYSRYSENSTGARFTERFVFRAECGQYWWRGILVVWRDVIFFYFGTVAAGCTLAGGVRGGDGGGGGGGGGCGALIDSRAPKIDHHLATTTIELRLPLWNIKQRILSSPLQLLCAIASCYV
ncbi:hypothetical protein E2C01_041199 [Portunus trituberculatus]|uniref:Uncharacterized protein n=1 Tax=Portunus trituberculatus TaxID=210409 RepID=A0A5B7FLY0_PORTR|nr:hypothetical protein [Portunus trituberculatus]